jgi:hypothetical protein
VHIGFDDARRFGLAPERLVADDDYSDCQDLADRLRGAGERGLVVPSAALPGARSVVLFGRYALARYDGDESSERIPGCLAADHARPPEQIEYLYRRRGAPHAALDAWKAGRPFRLRQPLRFA